jgi:hypothetical protein
MIEAGFACTDAKRNGGRDGGAAAVRSGRNGCVTMTSARTTLRSAPFSKRSWAATGWLPLNAQSSGVIPCEPNAVGGG